MSYVPYIAHSSIGHNMNKYEASARALQLMGQYAFRINRLGLRPSPVLGLTEIEAIITDVMESEKEEWMGEPHKLGSTYSAIFPSSMSWTELCQAVYHLEALQAKWSEKGRSY